MSQDAAGTGFAELLRELKDRSGLSYGTLAKRLHMSTSTLHRYCAGDVVPADYAPVERLARLCKASSEELVELHRRWVLADANRPRKGGEPGVKRPVGEPTATGTGTARTTPQASEDSAPPAVAESPVDLPELSGRPVPEQRRRHRKAALAGAAVAVIACAVALALNLPARHADAGGPAGGAASLPAGAAERTAGRTASASPAQASPSSSASAPAAPGAGGAGTDAAASPHPSGPGEHPATGTPVTVTAQPYTWESPCGQHYLIDKPPAQVSPPPLERDAPAWVAASGAVSAREQYVTLTLQGSGKETVVLDGLTVRTAGKRAPLARNDYAMGYPGVGCGAGVRTRSFSVALDAARPAVVPAAGQATFPFKVSESEPEVFYIKADASAYDVSWYLELAWTSGSRSGTLTVDNHGTPFRTSGNNGRPGYEFPLGGDGWVKAGTTS
ncbi:transcriptional regulator [Streptomyces sp. Sge12]|uniref:helix-turn-helix domain-containing protein n=1 Tax=Streptomyces sp. Sge12 TaxID=1972846 RepID=UPI0009C26B45|nr:helix-turn-helix transcriptional regulator [Streptomyces sp. Sge12]ARE77786.1 transcriptional regulator [Streptomyces sp. Sge12]